MSDAPERRGAARFITIVPLTLLDQDGGVLDATATAHDLSSAGFKGECLYAVQEGEVFRFTLALPDDRPPAAGRAKAVWVKKETFATWVGAKIVEMSWADRRRLRALVAPPTVAWDKLAGHLVNAVFWIVVVAALHRALFESRLWRRTLLDLVPSLLALFVMGWALSALTAKRK
ncbi:MAG: hypothetical protein SF051_12765 [Elusimicrobiota bacterium]|nr:hypothetical protein [Elusimicrobiota bacterium]